MDLLESKHKRLELLEKRDRMEFTNKLCLIFGHRYRCFMGFQSVCSRCGDIYDYNVKVCGICGGKLFLKDKRDKKKFLTCENGHLGNKHWKMTLEEYNQKIKDDFESRGLLHNFFKKEISLQNTTK